MPWGRHKKQTACRNASRLFLCRESTFHRISPRLIGKISAEIFAALTPAQRPNCNRKPPQYAKKLVNRPRFDRHKRANWNADVRSLSGTRTSAWLLLAHVKRTTFWDQYSEIPKEESLSSRTIIRCAQIGPVPPLLNTAIALLEAARPRRPCNAKPSPWKAS